jgi:Lipid A 3-O-deacylase (PagL)
MKRLLLLLAILPGLFTTAHAGNNAQPLPLAPTHDRFDAGAVELEPMSGVAGAPIVGNRISYHYAVTELRLGWMLYSPRGNGILRGNIELLAQLGGGGIFEGPGSEFGTAGALLRYNFVQPSARFVPYIQGGAAAFVSDISENTKQEDVGGTFEADLRAGIGTRFLICRGWSLNTEIFFEHVSNAGTETRNVGINALGGLFGVSRSF